MKKMLLLILAGACCLSVYAQGGAIPVHDPSFKQQRESHFHVGSWEHRPQWWYDLFYLRYQRNYNNNAAQLLPLIAANNATKKKTEETKEYTDTLAQMAMWQYLNRVVDIAWVMEANNIDTLKTQFLTEIEKYKNSDTPGCVENSELLMNEYEDVVDDIKIIKGSHLENARRREEYMEHEKRLMRLIDLTRKLNYAIDTYKRLKFY